MLRHEVVKVEIRSNEVHVYRLSLYHSPPNNRKLWKMLGPHGIASLPSFLFLRSMCIATISTQGIGRELAEYLPDAVAFVDLGSMSMMIHLFSWIKLKIFLSLLATAGAGFRESPIYFISILEWGIKIVTIIYYLRSRNCFRQTGKFLNLGWRRYGWYFQSVDRL